MRESEKLKWYRVGSSYHLKVINYKVVNTKKLKKLLGNVERPNPEYNKSFNKRASQLFNRWFDDPSQPLREAAYTLLSNWFLNDCSASKSTRAEHAGRLWDALFCVRPERRLTNWRISGSRVIPHEFNLWWKKQVKCQESNKTI